MFGPFLPWCQHFLDPPSRCGENDDIGELFFREEHGWNETELGEKLLISGLENVNYVNGTPQEMVHESLWIFDVNPSTLVGISNKKLSRYPNCSPKWPDQSHSTQSLLLVVSCRLEGTKEAKVITLDPNTTSEPIQVDAHFWGRQKVPCFFRVFFNDPLNKMWGWTDGHFGDIFGMVILDL